MQSLNRLLLVLLFLCKSPAHARPPLEEKTITYQSAKFTIASLQIGANPSSQSTGKPLPLIQLYLEAPSGKPFSSFQKLKDHLSQHDRELVFAMNAGMFHRDKSPVGLTIIKKKTASPLNLENGKGNFFLKPNGLFGIKDNGEALILPSPEFAKNPAPLKLATQSGPLLVIKGNLHPAFNKDSKNKNIRNGIGLSADNKTIHFVISEDQVNFHHFARLFRDHLHCPNALYLDGVISSLYSKKLKRHDKAHQLGPIFAISLIIEK